MSGFKQHVDEGLSASPKQLSSRYLYNKIGDDLFVQIMNMEEYYLTDAEMEIFRDKTDEIISCLDLDIEQPFELTELGAGDGTKTEHLLRRLLSRGFSFKYVPIDISLNALGLLRHRLEGILPELDVAAMQGEYFEVLDDLSDNEVPKVILFVIAKA